MRGQDTRPDHAASGVRSAGNDRGSRWRPERLRAAPAYFAIPFDREAVGASILDVASDDTVLRITLAQDGSLGAAARPLPALPDGPVRLALDDEPIDPSEPMFFHKTTARAAYDRRRARHPQADQVVLCNLRGEVTETDIANIAVRRGEAWITPDLACGLLPGIERERLLGDGTIRSGVVSVDELRRAPQLAVFNSVRGWQDAFLLP